MERRRQCSVWKRRVGRLTRLSIVISAIVTLSGCQFVLNVIGLGAGPAPGGGPGDEPLAPTAAAVTDGIESSLASTTTLSDADIQAIVGGAVGSITSGTQAADDVVFVDAVAGAQASLGGFASLTSVEREAAVAAIVAGAVGSISSVNAPTLSGSTIGARTADSDPTAELIARISRASVASLDEAGFASPAFAARATRASARGAVSGFGLAGLNVRQLNGALAGVSRGAVKGLGEAGVDAGNAPSAFQTIPGELVSRLNDIPLPDGALDLQLAELVGAVTSGTAGALADTGISGLDDATRITDAVRTITESTTRAVRDVNVNDAAAAVSRVLRAVTNSAATAIQAVNDTGRVSISVADTVQAVVAGTSRGAEDLVTTLSQRGVTVETNVLAEVAQGASEGGARLATTSGETFDAAAVQARIEDAVREVETQLVSLRTQIAELEDQVATLVTAGQTAADNTAPVAAVSVAVGDGTATEITGDFVEVAADTTITLSATGSTDEEGDSLLWIWFYEGGAADSITFYSDAARQTPIANPRSGAFDTVYFALDSPGEYAFVLTVDDGTDVDRRYFTLGIPGSAANDPPTARLTARVNGEARTSLIVGETIAFDASRSSDPQGVALTYSWRVLEPGVTTYEEFASGSPIEEYEVLAAGRYRFVVRVSDGEFIDSAAISVDVTEPNTAPAITSVTIAGAADPTEPVVVDAGAPLPVSAEASDPDDDTVAIRWLVDPPTATVDPVENDPFAATLTFDAAGLYVVTLIASDGFRETERTFDVSVTDDRTAVTFAVRGGEYTLPPEVTGGAEIVGELLAARLVGDFEGWTATDEFGGIPMELVDGVWRVTRRFATDVTPTIQFAFQGRVAGFDGWVQPPFMSDFVEDPAFSPLGATFVTAPSGVGDVGSFDFPEPDVIAPIAVSDVNAVATGDGAIVSWTDPTSDPDLYRILVSEPTSGFLTAVPVGEGSVRLFGFPEGVAITVAIEAQDSSGNVSTAVTTSPVTPEFTTVFGIDAVADAFMKELVTEFEMQRFEAGLTPWWVRVVPPGDDGAPPDLVDTGPTLVIATAPTVPAGATQIGWFDDPDGDATLSTIYVTTLGAPEANSAEQAFVDFALGDDGQAILSDRGGAFYLPLATGSVDVDFE